jgi:serine O-acetyltransferase
MLLLDRLGILASDRYTRSIGADVTFTDLLLVWLIPVGVLAAACLGVPFVVYVLMRAGADFDFKHDLLNKYDRKRLLPSGRGRKLSYGYVLGLLLGDNCMQATFLYRVSRFLTTHRLRPLAKVVHAFAKFATNIDVSPGAEIGRGLYLYHGLGTVIGKGTIIGERALICQGVTMGGGAKAGDDVSLWAGAKLIGKVFVGDRSDVGANAVVIRDVPADSLAVGVPATVRAKTAEIAGPEQHAQGLAH